MKIVVTGGAGFIGSHLVERLLAGGHEVQVIDNLATGRRANVPRGAHLHECDIHARETGRVLEQFRPQAVAHLAAQSSVKVSTADPVHDLEINGGGTLAVASLCVEYGVAKLVYVSTGGAIYGDPESLPVREDHPLRPTSPYAVSKRVGEVYVEMVGRTAGLDYTNLRLANAYGPRQDPYGEAGVVAIFTGRMLAGEPCTIDGDGEQEKDYVYVGDLSRAIELALGRGSGLAMNIGTGRGTSVNSIFAALQKATGTDLSPVHGPPRPGDVRRVWLDSSLARAELGWEPEVGLEEGLQLTVDWFRASSGRG